MKFYWGVFIQAIFVYKSLLDDSTKEVPIHIQDKKDIENFMQDLLDNNEQHKSVTLIAGENKVVPVPIYDVGLARWHSDAVQDSSGKV